MRWFSLQVGVLSFAMPAWAPPQASQEPERATQPFSFFHPVIELGGDDIERIRSGGVVTHTIRGSGHDVAVLAAGSLKTTPDAFISRVTDIVQLRKSRVVSSKTPSNDSSFISSNVFSAPEILASQHLVDHPDASGVAR
jgi:hypothetical protein